MHLLVKGEYRVDMRVILEKPAPNYFINDANPARGSKFFCEGSIINVYRDQDGVSVRWDNGKTNGYKSGELALIDNCGIVKDLWRNV
jgi:hypothetical protein